MEKLVNSCRALKAKREELDRLSELVKAATKEYEEALSSVCSEAGSQGMPLNTHNAWPFARVILGAISYEIPPGLGIDLRELVEKEGDI